MKFLSFTLVIASMLICDISKGQDLQGLDLTFGDNGVFRYQNDSLITTSFYASAIDKQNRVFLSGRVVLEANRTRSFIMRLTENGQLDTVFAETGINIIHTPDSSDCTGIFVIVQQDQKTIVVSSCKTELPNHYPKLVFSRFDTNGEMDMSYGVNGFADFLFTHSGQTIRDVQLQSDGKIVLLANGSYQESTNVCNIPSSSLHTMSLYRFDTNGALDSTFQLNDQILFCQDSTDLISNDLFLDEFDRILVFGHRSHRYNHPPSITIKEKEFVVVRFTKNGVLDDTYADNGISIISYKLDEYKEVKYSLTHFYTRLGESLFTGKLRGERVLMFKLDKKGNLIENFGNNGFKVFETSFIPGFTCCGSINNLIKLPSDEILVARELSTNPAFLEEHTKVTLTKYTLEGAIVPSFGDQGHQTNDLGVFNEYVSNLKLQHTNDVIALIQYEYDYFEGSFIIRYPAEFVVADHSLPEIVKNSFSIFPNPTSGNLNIELDSKARQQLVLAVYAMDGRSIGSKQILDVHQGNQILPINLPNKLPSGNYLIAIQGMHWSSTQMIHIQN